MLATNRVVLERLVVQHFQVLQVNLLNYIENDFDLMILLCQPGNPRSPACPCGPWFPSGPGDPVSPDSPLAPS